jgi:hypothetical protein
MDDTQRFFIGLYTIFALGWFVVWGATGDPLAGLVSVCFVLCAGFSSVI